MQVQLTDAAVTALNATGTPPTLGIFKLGSSFNYTPEATDTDIHGTNLFQGTVTAPIIINANLTKYGITLDTSIGDLYFGEAGIYLPNNQLFALASNDTLIAKIKQNGANEGNQIRIDIYLSIVGTNYATWTDVADSNSKVQLSTVETVDQLMPSKDAIPNAFIVQAVGTNQTSFMAYADRNGLWNFDQYKYSADLAHEYTIVSASGTSLDLAIADYNTTMPPTELGDRIVQFTTGANYSICRNVSAVVYDLSAQTVTFSFATALSIPPVAGDKFLIYFRESTEVVPAAKTNARGVVIVGDGLSVTMDGTLSVNRDTIPGNIVKSINNMQGDVHIVAADIPNSILTINSNHPDGNGNINVLYTLPAATANTLGGVIIGNGLTIDGSDRINVNPQPHASASVLGLVRIGAGLTINTDGVVTANVSSIPIAGPGTLGAVITGGVNSGLSVDGTGHLTVNPIAISQISGLQAELDSSVKTVNGKSPTSGAVTIATSDISGLDTSLASKVTSVNTLTPISGNVTIGISNISGLTTAIANAMPNKLLVVANASTTIVLDVSLSNAISVFDLTLTQPNCAISFSLDTIPDNISRTITIMLRHSAASTNVTLPGNIKWVGNAAPLFSTSSGKTDTIVITTNDKGATWNEVSRAIADVPVLTNPVTLHPNVSASIGATGSIVVPLSTLDPLFTKSNVIVYLINLVPGSSTDSYVLRLQSSGVTPIVYYETATITGTQVDAFPFTIMLNGNDMNVSITNVGASTMVGATMQIIVQGA